MSGSLPEIFVISLEGAVERRRLITEQLSRLGMDFRFFDAVNGRQLTPEQQNAYAGRRRRLLFGRDLTPGEIGCLLSHRGVYLRIAEENIPAALVLEDDAVLSGDLPGVLRALMQRPVEWDVIRFLSFGKTLGQSRVIGPLWGKYSLGRPRGMPGGAYGYLLSLRAAKALARNMRKNWVPADTLQGEIWRTGLLRSFNVLPSPVDYDDVIESTIGDTRFDKTRSLKGWERRIYPATRLGRKLYEMGMKHAVRGLTWPLDRKLARLLQERKAAGGKNGE